MYNILIAEDEIKLQETMYDYLTAKGFNVTLASDGKIACELFELNQFDLVLMDIMMPNIDGFSLCRKIRKISKVPIVFITARCSEDDQLFGFELGADDYIIKPFSLSVLSAKCYALISRSKGFDKENVIEISELKINLNTHQVFNNGSIIMLSPKEYDLLKFLIENRNSVLTREQLLNKVWGYDYYGDIRVVDTHIKKLRKSLGDKSSCIKTVIKVGYRFAEE